MHMLGLSLVEEHHEGVHRIRLLVGGPTLDLILDSTSQDGVVIYTSTLEVHQGAADSSLIERQAVIVFCGRPWVHVDGDFSALIDSPRGEIVNDCSASSGVSNDAAMFLVFATCEASSPISSLFRRH